MSALRTAFRIVAISRPFLVNSARTISISPLSLADRHYTKKHEWITVEGDIGTVGISTFAAESLGDIVYAELPEEGKEIEAGDSVGAVESVKAASDVYSPVSGTVTAKNAEVEENPALINKSAYEKGWLFKLKLKDASEIKKLMDEEAYTKFKKEEEEKSD